MISFVSRPAGPAPVATVVSGGAITGGGFSPTPTPTPTPTILARASDALLFGDAWGTWWIQYGARSFDGTKAAMSFTNGTGKHFVSSVDPVTGVPFDTRDFGVPISEKDEHLGGATTFLPNGSLLRFTHEHSFMLNGYKNAASTGRILATIAEDGLTSSLHGTTPGSPPVVYTLPSTLADKGANYGYFRVINSQRFIFWTNNDALVSWKPLYFTDGKIENGVWLRALVKNVPAGGGGQDQLYMLDALIAPNIERCYFQPHSSNLRNRIRYADVNLDTGAVTSGAMSYGNLFDTSQTATMIDLAATNPELHYDPGVGNSYRLQDAYGYSTCGTRFVNADNSNARHIVVENNVEWDIGPVGRHFGQVLVGPYFPDIKRARELHTGYRFYRTFNDGTVGGTWTLEMVEADFFGDTSLRRTTIKTGPTPLLRIHVMTNASPELAGYVVEGSYTSYQNMNTGMKPFSKPLSGGGGADATPPVVGPATGTVAENVPYSVTLIANEAVTWTKIGGADSALFTLSGATLTMAAKDFEAPADADANNSYTVVLRATDGAGNATDLIHAVTVTDVLEGSGRTRVYYETCTSGTAVNFTGHTSDDGATYTALAGSLSCGATGRSHTVAPPYEYLISTVMPTADIVEAEILVAKNSAEACSIAFLLDADMSATPTALGMNINNNGTVSLVQYNGAAATNVVASINRASIVAGERYRLRRVRSNGGAVTLELFLNDVSIIAATAVANAPTGNRMHLRGSGNPTSATIGLGYDEIAAYSL